MQDARTAEVVKKVLERESTQLVVLNGDIISGYGTMADNATLYLDQAVKPIVDAGLPWATTYGNHDNQAYSKSKDLLKREQHYNNSLTKNMLPDNPEAGVSNYFLQVYSASGHQDVPELILWFFDSRGGKETHDWVDDSVNFAFPVKLSLLTLTRLSAGLKKPVQISPTVTRRPYRRLLFFIFPSQPHTNSRNLQVSIPVRNQASTAKRFVGKAKDMMGRLATTCHS